MELASPSVRSHSHTGATIPRSFRLLAIDDEPGFLGLLGHWFSGLDSLELHTAQTAAAGLHLAHNIRPGMVLLDLNLPDRGGMEVLVDLLAHDPGCEVVLLTGTYSVDSAVEAIRLGATDYLTKPVSKPRLREVVQRWIDRAEIYERANEIEAQLSASFNFEGIVGRSPAVLDLFDRIQRVAPHFTNALITGETGTGKELVAQVLHKLGPHPDKPFLVCNCAAIAESLFESELFGHARGSYTGAHSTQTGLIEHAAGGTLFLDEIGEIPVHVQAKLLRFLQSREIQRIGDPATRRVDVRIIAATNRDLADLIKEGKFRSDLYYRLAMVELHTPRLADRKEDLGVLAHHFLHVYATRFSKPGLRLTRRARGLISRYYWPGNVRELENAIHYAAMMARARCVDVEDFPDAIRMHPEAAATVSRGKIMKLDELEVAYALEILERVNGNRSRAAELLGIGRTTLYRILDKAGVGSDLEVAQAGDQRATA